MGKELEISRLPEQGASHTDVFTFYSTILWLNTGWDSMGNLVSEVEQPLELVSGLAWAAALVLLVYLTCLWGALGFGSGTWSDGYLAVAFGKYFPPLTPWISACAAVGNIVMYTTELTTLTRLVLFP